MTKPSARLHLLCGRIASGKSTLSAKLVEAEGAVLISEDEWLSALYGDRMSTVEDFVHFSRLLRSVLKPHIVSLLKAGVSVVLDFQANTVNSRAWMRSIFEEAGADHRLHFLDVPDAVCLERLKARNAAGEHAFSASEEQFHEVTRHFMPPGDDEGFAIIRYTASA